MSAMATGEEPTRRAASTPGGAASTPGSRPRSASPAGKKKKAPFLASAARGLRLELMGEETPGPGTYMPASTFGVHGVKPSAKSMASMGSSQFKSKSLQRVPHKTLNVPGPGAHEIKWTAVEKTATNPAMQLKAKGKSRLETKVATEPNATGDVGPGEYNEHLHKSLQKDVEVKVGMMSKQNPGFGIAGPAHKLPHEQEVEDDKELPGPGKYETNISQLKGDGHASSFKMPTERKKGKGFIEEAAAVEKKSAKSKKAKPKSVAKEA